MIDNDIQDIQEILNKGFGFLDVSLVFRVHRVTGTEADLVIHVYYEGLHVFNWQYNTRVWKKEDLLEHFSKELLDSGRFESQLLCLGNSEKILAEATSSEWLLSSPGEEMKCIQAAREEMRGKD